MKSLEELTQEDNTLRRLVSETQGSIKHQIQIIVDSEVSLRFKRLYEDYVLLYREAGILEGLKRSLFFQWYAAVEPPFLTGFFFGPPFDTSTGLSLQTQTYVLSKLDSLAELSELDLELQTMLPYYYLIADYCFTSFSTPNLLSFLHATSNFRLDNISKASMLGRGRMGEYWRSILPETSHRNK